MYAPYERTPVIGADEIKHLIKGKAVYDIGCGEGDFALALAEHAKEVIGIEIDPHLWNTAIDRGLNVYKGNFNMVPYERDSVIFIFMNLFGGYALIETLREQRWKGTIISHFYPLQDTPFKFIEPTEIIKFKSGVDSFAFHVYEDIDFS